jgi:hypothetical protein
MVTTTLISSSSSNECRHSLKDLVKTAHLSIEEVALVLKQKQEVQPLLMTSPMTDIHTLQLLVPTSVLAELQNLYKGSLWYGFLF